MYPALISCSTEDLLQVYFLSLVISASIETQDIYFSAPLDFKWIDDTSASQTCVFIINLSGIFVSLLHSGNR